MSIEIPRGLNGVLEIIGVSILFVAKVEPRTGNELKITLPPYCLALIEIQ